tara:strand:- start:52 stop:288 length:237 start_codon:yes stop_codon:yes gene_type:complete
MEMLKSLWAKWRVHVSVIGGVLVIATAYGTCSVDPATVSTNTTTTTVVPVKTVASPDTVPEEGTVDVAATTETATTTE